MIVSAEGVRNTTHPRFRRRAVELARLQEKPMPRSPRTSGSAESCLRRWMGQADVDDGLGDLTKGTKRAELVGCGSETGPGDGSGDPQTGPVPASGR